MANTVLQTYMDANPGKGPVEAAVEVILDNLSAGAAGGLTNAQLRASAVPVSISSVASDLPYGADNYTVSYYGSTNNVHVVTYKQGSTTVKTRTFTYAASGAADNDKLTAVVDS